MSRLEQITDVATEQPLTFSMWWLWKKQIPAEHHLTFHYLKRTHASDGPKVNGYKLSSHRTVDTKRCIEIFTPPLIKTYVLLFSSFILKTLVSMSNHYWTISALSDTLPNTSFFGCLETWVLFWSFTNFMWFDFFYFVFFWFIWISVLVYRKGQDRNQR